MDYTIYGIAARGDGSPLVHGRRIGSPHPLHINNPPAGLFRWHYLQCVIRRFGHHQYTDLPNINLFEMPFRMEGDSDDDGTDNEVQWPSMALDLGRSVEQSMKEHAESHRAVENWIDSSA